MDNEHSVSVVIPTRHRSDLVVGAVWSALGQTVAPREVVVVVDGPDPDTVEALERLDDARVLVHVHPEPRRAGAARNTGVELATADLVAFLDDDDTWSPVKLERQVAHWAAAADRDHLVVGCQARFDTGHGTHVWPTRCPRPQERVADYLFVRDHAGEGALPTPTLLLPRELAAAHPMPTHLVVHEEWDWLLDLERDGARVEVVLEPLVDVDARPRRASVSSDSDWQRSMAWALNRVDDLGPRGFSAFMLTEVARAAVLGHSGPAAHQAVLATALTGRPRPRDVARFVGRPAVVAARRLRQGRP